MGNIRRRSSVLLSAVLGMSIVSACSGELSAPKPAEVGSGSTGVSEEGQPVHPFDKHMDISISHYNIGKAFPSRRSDELLKSIESKFNVTFVDQVVSYSDYVEKYQLWSTSGDLPDIFSHDIINTGTYYSWIKQGIIRELPDDLDAYPNIQKVMRQEDVRGLNVDGKYYMIPRLTYNDNDQKALERALIVRKDWMENLNLQDPVTYEDYLHMLAAFAKEDPDGNNKQDTVGVTSRTDGMMTAIGSGSFPNVANNSWVKEDGKYIPFYASERMEKYITRMRELYTAGAIDPDFAIMQTNDGIEKFGQGKVGAIAMQTTPSGLKLLETAWNKYNKGTELTDVIKVLPISWEADDGSRYSYNMLSFWSETYFSANVDEEKMERILHIYDYLLSDEYMMMNLYGMEGKDYRLEGEKFVITREKDESGQYKSLLELYPSLHLFGSLAAWYKWQEYEDSEITRINLGEKLFHLVQDTLEEFVDLQVIPTNFEVDMLHTETKAKLSAINPTEDIIKVILGKEDPVQMWRDIVKGYDNKGLQKAIEEVHEAVQAQGLDN